MPPYVHPETPRIAVACSCALGEEVIWEPQARSLTWVDIENPAVWRYWPETDTHRRYATPEKIGFALPTADPDVVVAGLKSGVVRLRLSDGSREVIVTPDPHPANNRLNSGNVGPDGALYFGTMDDAEEVETGTFHRWDGRTLQSFGGTSAVTNGPVVSPDGSRVYTVDTASSVVRAHALDRGQIGQGRPLITFESGWGKPDGLTIDAEGYLWICHYSGSRISRFSPDGTIERVIPVPTPFVTKCAFAGPNLTTLYITTARRGRDPQIDPMAGHLFMVEAGIKGLPGNTQTFDA